MGIPKYVCEDRGISGVVADALDRGNWRLLRARGEVFGSERGGLGGM